MIKIQTFKMIKIQTFKIIVFVSMSLRKKMIIGACMLIFFFFLTVWRIVMCSILLHFTLTFYHFKT